MSKDKTTKPVESTSEPSLPKDKNVPNDGRTATGDQAGAPAAPASGKPTQAPSRDNAKLENQTNVNAGTGAQVIGTVPDRVTINFELGKIMNDIENLMTRVRNSLGDNVNYDHEDLDSHLSDARDWVAKEVGLKKTDNGWVNESFKKAADDTDKK